MFQAKIFPLIVAKDQFNMPVRVIHGVAVTKCLLNAKGATRTSQQVREEFGEFVHDHRIDHLVKELKKNYKDEIGKCIRSQQGKGYWLEAHESE